MTDGNPYEDVQIRPDWRQLLIDEGVSILGALGLLVVGGLDGVAYHSVFFCLGLLLVFKVYYKDYDERKGKVLEHYRNSYWYYYEFIKPINHKQQQEKK